jgi:hypothetical protein
MPDISASSPQPSSKRRGRGYSSPSSSERRRNKKFPLLKEEKEQKVPSPLNGKGLG